MDSLDRWIDEERRHKHFLVLITVAWIVGVIVGSIVSGPAIILVLPTIFILATVSFLMTTHSQKKFNERWSEHVLKEFPPADKASQNNPADDTSLT